MAYKKGQDRRQRVLFPDCIDEYVEADAPVRLFDAFVDSLKMDELGFVRSTPAETGTPGYNPRDLLKLYIYGYFYQVRSSRKLARECKCTIQKFKEADFNKDTLIKATEAKRKQLKEENKDKPKPPRMKVVKKVVRYVLHLDQNKMDNRKCLSEHPFGTMKRALGQYYFLLKGKLKVTAEMGLFCLSYNLCRAISLKGVPALIASLG